MPRMTRWSVPLVLVLLPGCSDAPVAPEPDAATPVFAVATGGATILLPGDGYEARAITPAGWVLGFSRSATATRAFVSWDPTDNWRMHTIVGAPTTQAERLTNSRGDAIPQLGSPSVTTVMLATSGGGPYTMAPGNPVAPPVGVYDQESWGAAHLNHDLTLVGSGYIGPAYTGMWYPMYWPYIGGGWPEPRRLPGPTSMASAIAGAINDSGLVVGDIGIGTASENTVVARAWILHGTGAATTADTLPTLPWYPGAELMEATAVNNEGLIVGYYRRNGNDYPVAWHPAAKFEYRYPSTPVALSIKVSSSQNLPVNSCGWIALVEYRRIKGSNRTYGVVWNAWTNTVLELPMPSGFTDASPYDIANNGNVVGTATVRTKQGSTTRAVLWQGYIPPCE